MVWGEAVVGTAVQVDAEEGVSELVRAVPVRVSFVAGPWDNAAVVGTGLAGAQAAGVVCM